ncbi:MULTISPECIES: TraR/DksA family transcriptional regulator [Treponema]|uniref:DnaK suppressor, putative n=7 Tax=Treponema TaxID=157 RepID=O83134_TREPA|nr:MULTISPECIES: TraR/DksA family transcriptional regulator [Treponema]AAC65091.1 dnaK suppressor, putative [Treponema pallidum subsp. pallidum str. Nichols]ACD70523.1 possible dnaK suppressor [Treponema pallidum subsp. pallidum SS14]ADD72250.1 C4 zinc finger domain protein, DksA/TraR family [Treponema pallidum subsp. pallidum str. Chicago]AEH40052.1 probable DnaK suppressor protein [Treponema paraluiscuniculi Cuniculi A]AEZ57215.1 putative DnaK suppressor protein [Treponema pallidum subsp. pe
MDQSFVEEMKVSLVERKRSLARSLTTNNEDFQAIVAGVDPKDSADIASDDMDRKMLESLSAKDLRCLQQIESALLRIEQGRYGKCADCGESIPEDRLRAIPYSLMCIECQSARESKRRAF